MQLLGKSVVCAVLSASNAATAADLDVAGRWYTPDKASIVEIVDCGDGTPCGVVAWVHGHAGMTVDAHNRDPALKGRDMLGVRLFHGFKRHDGRWASGAIYSPEDGRTYRARLELVSENSLAVSGCLGPICKKLLWERATSDVATVLDPEATGEAEWASLD